MGASNPTTTAVTSARFATLAPRIKNVSQATIQKKWKPLPASSQEKVRQILFDIKTKRSGAGGSRRIPAVVSKTLSSQETRARAKSRVQTQEEEYEKAVEEVAERLLSRLPRMPFPPTNGSRAKSKAAATGAADDSFDLSATLHRITTLQAELTMNTQSANLLRMQIKREQTALRRDRAELAQLESALRSSQTLRRKREKGLHPLARDLDNQSETETTSIERMTAIAGIGIGRDVSRRESADGGRSLSDYTSARISCLDVENQPDLELHTLLRQLRNHLGSMQNNMACLNPVMAAMDDAKMELDRFALGTFDEEALRRICGLQES